VGSEDEVAVALRIVVVEDVLDRDEVAERLGHLLAVDLEEAAVHPEARELLAAACLALGDLVLVMGEDEVHPTAVDVDLFAQLFERHRRALDVPPGAPLAPRAIEPEPVGASGLPEGEVERVTLHVARAVRKTLARAGAQVVEVAPGELAVAGEAS